MNANKIKQLAEKMGWKLRIKPKSIKPGDCWMIGDQLVIYPAHGKSHRNWNPEASDADMVELLQKLGEKFSGEDAPSGQFNYCLRIFQTSGTKEWVVVRGTGTTIYGQAPTLRAAVVAFACKVYGIEE